MAVVMPKVSMQGITKQFPGVLANDKIDVDFYQGEVHALLGENGAGKTTLMNILYGLHKPDSGEILIDGKKCEISDPNSAIRLGIGMVHQHFMLVPPFTVAENIVLGSEPVKGLFQLDQNKAISKVRELSEMYGLKVDPTAKVESISVGMQQRVEILKALYRGANILILDEPTAVLTPQEVLDLKNITDGLAAQGKTIIIITHKLKEVMAMAKRVTVIRKGRKINTFETEGSTPQDLARAMVGRDVVLEVPKGDCKPGDVVLDIDNIWVKNNRGLDALKGVSFSVKEGEIVGIAGVEGNGQSELVEVISGLRQPKSGSLKLSGISLNGKKPRVFGKMGVAHIPEDRQKRGLVMDFSIAENAVLDRYHEDTFAKGIFLDYKKVNEFGRKLISEYDVRTPSETVSAKSLSGGNQQKVIIGRELDRNPKLLVAAQPTRGLDVGAIEFVHRRLIDARDSGKAVVLVSLELDEIIALSDRVLVMYEGKVVADLPVEAVTEEKLGLLMAGVSPERVTESSNAEGGDKS